MPADFAALAALLEEKGEVLLAEDLRSRFGLVRYAPPDLVLKPLKSGASDFARRVSLCLKAVTGVAWSIELQELGGAEASLREQEEAAIEAERARLLADPAVRAVLEVFPDATSMEPSNGAG